MNTPIITMNKKLKNKGGYTIVEVIIATLLFTFVSLIMVGGVNLAAREYRRSLRESQAQVLYSTLSSIIRNELLYTTHIEVDASGFLTEYQSLTYGESGYSNFQSLDASDTCIDYDQTSFSAENVKSGDQVLTYGYIAVGNDSHTTQKKVLADKAYSEELMARVASVKYDRATHTFTVWLVIAYNQEVEVMDSFTVKNVNNTIPS